MNDVLLFHMFIGGLPTTKGSLSAVVTALFPSDAGRLKCPHCRAPLKASTQLLEKKSPHAREVLEAWRTNISVQLRAEWNRQGRILIAAERRNYLKPIAATLLFHLPRPPSLPSYAVFPTTYPDIDKLTRVVLDELRATVCKDDRQIIDLNVKKRYAETPRDAGVAIFIHEATESG